jgi:hypothetical protein
MSFDLSHALVLASGVASRAIEPIQLERQQAFLALRGLRSSDCLLEQILAPNGPQ